MEIITKQIVFMYIIYDSANIYQYYNYYYYYFFFSIKRISILFRSVRNKSDVGQFVVSLISTGHMLFKSRDKKLGYSKRSCDIV